MPPENPQADGHNSSSDDGPIPAPRLKLITEGILIDFLGGLVPGMLFIVAIFFALAIPTHTLISILAGGNHKSWSQAFLEYSSNIRQTPSAFWISVFFTFSLISFVIGNMFYRNDPKIPDQNSFRKLSRGMCADECEKEFGCANYEDCKFPYGKYDEYLKARGLNHLIPLVVWCNESGPHQNDKQHEKRSKQYINIYKIRLRHHFPDKCTIIIWNEAHIRLAASSWYLANTLLVAGVCGLAIAFISFVLVYQGSLTVNPAHGFFQFIGNYASSILSPLFVLVFSLLSKSQIERFMHYQRLREVFFVLETTYTAFHKNYNLLAPPLDEAAIRKLTKTMGQTATMPAANIAGEKVPDQLPIQLR